MFSSNKISFCVGLVVSALTFQSTVEAAVVRRQNGGDYEQLASTCKSSNVRAESVKSSFSFAFNGYTQYAYGFDDLLPVSNGFYNSRNGWGATIVDALDTMLIMGLEEDYQKALGFVKNIDFSRSDSSSKGFETNIRYLGGLLAANDLRPDPILVQKAVEVTDLTLIPLFVDSTSMGKSVKVPYTNMNLNTHAPEVVNIINLAEFGSYSMEFTRLSQVTGNPKYEELANNLVDAIIQQPTRMPGLFPTSWTVKPFAPVNTSTITIAGGGDSFYEYLIKNYVLQTGKNQNLLNVWQDAVESIEEYMLSPTAENPDIKFVAMVSGDNIQYVSQELICYWPGNILLGLPQVNDEQKRTKFKNFADTFFISCIETWANTATGIAPETWGWNPQDNQLETKLVDLSKNTLKQSETANKTSTANNTEKNAAQKRADSRTFQIGNSFYDLRPETIESVFYYYRLTGDTIYQDLAWNMYLAIEKYAKANSGYTRIDNVDQVPVKHQDFQESFFLAETLKYLYLIFADKNCISLNDYVFNTEAHPFKLSEPIQYQ